MSVKNSLKEKAKNYLFSIPKELEKNIISISTDSMKKIEQSIRKNFHTDWRSEDKFTPEDYKIDFI